MLATPATTPPDGDGWAFEIKWDGVRALAYCEDGALRISSRRGEDASHRYPELTGLPEALGGRMAILDGEVVAFDAEGRPSFQTLQKRMGLSRPETIRRRSQEVPVTFVAFDLLHLDSESLLAEPYERRRELLAELELDGDCWRAPAHRIGEGPAFLDAARAQGLEGIVCKRLGTPYRPGRRSADWLKIRARLRQELVVGGYMPGEGGRTGSVGSLLVGYWDRTPEEAVSTGSAQKLVYAGRRRDRLHGRDAEAPARASGAPAHWTRWRSSWARTRASSTRAAPGPAAPGPSGSSRSSSARSSSRSGPSRAPSASRRSRAFATTRLRARSCARRRDAFGRPPIPFRDLSIGSGLPTHIRMATQAGRDPLSRKLPGGAARTRGADLSERRKSVLVEHSSEMMLVVSHEGSIQVATGAVDGVMEHDATELVGRSVLELVHPRDRGLMSALMKRVTESENGATEQSGWRMRRASGTWVDVEVVATNLINELQIGGVLLNCRDISASKAFEEQLRHRAFHDPLTHLPNRALPARSHGAGAGARETGRWASSS